MKNHRDRQLAQQRLAAALGCGRTFGPPCDASSLILPAGGVAPQRRLPRRERNRLGHLVIAHGKNIGVQLVELVIREVKTVQELDAASPTSPSGR